MGNKNLKPCPFCGGNEVFTTLSNSSNHTDVGFYFKIECEDCGIEIPNTFEVRFVLNKTGVVTTLEDQRDMAIDKWNSRASGF